MRELLIKMENDVNYATKTPIFVVEGLLFKISIQLRFEIQINASMQMRGWWLKSYFPTRE